MKKLIVSGIALLLCACSNSGGGGDNSVHASGADPAGFASEPGDCKQFLSSLPSDISRGWVDVPENPFDPKSNQIKVFYYGKITNPNNVIAFYNGGPGSDSHSSYRHLSRIFENNGMSSDLSMIYIDQRGTGCSSPYPSGKSDDDIMRSKWYGSTGIAYDSEAIRQKLLGDKKWKIFGQSYGAFIVHRYVSLFPQSIDKAYAHANTINADPYQRMLARIESQQRVLGLYLAQYPTDKQLLQTIKSQLTLNMCYFATKMNTHFCGHEVLSGLIALLGFSNDWMYFHDALTTMVVGNTISTYGIQSVVNRYIDETQPAYGSAITTVDIFDRNVANYNYTNCLKVYADMENDMHVTGDDILFNECMPSMQDQTDGKRWPHVLDVLAGARDTLTIDKFKAGLNILGGKNFYLYSGQKDCFVPVASFQEELAEVKDLINYTNFPNSGHDGFYTESQVLQDLLK